MRINHIDIRRHFLTDMMEDKDIDIKYIWSEENPAGIMTKNDSKVDFVKQVKRIIEGGLWELVENGRENVNNTRVADDVIKHYKT